MTATSISALTVALPSDTEIVMTRSFDAPRRLVFDAWTKPEHIRRWFGPRGWTVPECEIDLRAGGRYRFVLGAPDGKQLCLSGVYCEVDAPEFLVNTEVFDLWPGIECVGSLLLEEHDGKTTMTAHFVYGSKEDRDLVLEDGGMEAGAGESMERLEELLRSITSTSAYQPIGGEGL